MLHTADKVISGTKKVKNPPRASPQRKLNSAHQQEPTGCV